jgi:hypothetical protein
VIAPTGAAFCEACGLGDAIEGRLIFGAWGASDIRAATLTADRKGIQSQTVILDWPVGVVAVERGTDRGVYFSDPGGIFKLTGP